MSRAVSLQHLDTAVSPPSAAPRPETMTRASAFGADAAQITAPGKATLT
jgi:hypothetical protein